jgi:tetratricopeptide (TPR) repeat protein
VGLSAEPFRPEEVSDKVTSQARGEETLLHRFCCCLVVVALLGGRAALADDASDAKSHYQKATAHYAVGEYKEAADEYEAAFKLKQDPALLYNAAQSHRLAGNNQKALLLYKNLVKLYPNTKYSTEAKDRIEKLEEAIATTQSPPNGPAPVGDIPSGVAAPAPTAPPPPVPPAPAVAAAPAPLVTAAPPPAADTNAPIYKKWWFWAGAGAVVAAGVITAVALSSGGTTTPWSNVPDVRAGLSAGVR